MPLNNLDKGTRARLLTWLDQPEGKVFNELVQEWLGDVDKVLRRSDEPFEVHRAQGAILYLRMILDLRNDLRAFSEREMKYGLVGQTGRQEEGRKQDSPGA